MSLLVKGKKRAEMEEQISNTVEEIIRIDENLNTPLVLIWMKDKGKLPIVSTTLCDKENYGIHLNELINIMNEDYKGQMSLELYLCSTAGKERAARFEKDPVGLSDISKVFEKLPKGKSKPVLVFDADKTVDYSKIHKLFSPEDFMIRINEIGLLTADMQDQFRSRGYKVLNTAEEFFDQAE